MANILLTSLYADLNSWPGRLLEAPTGTTILTKTATSFVLGFPAGGDFSSYRISVSGTGFAYVGNVPVAGTMSTVNILNASGQVVISFSGLAANPFANDLSQFAADVMGSQNDIGDGPEPNGKVAWSLLMSGNDVITGTAGNDDRGLVGLDAGNDVYNMGAGDDQVNGGMGNDTINGGDGFDTLRYDETHYNDGASATRGLVINMQTGVAIDVWGGRDTFTGIERVFGSRFNDLMVGSSNQDRFIGGRGRDVFDGGDNSFDGLGVRTEDRRDIVEYENDYWVGGMLGVVADLETAFAGGSVSGFVRDGFGNIDTVRDIERVFGTRFADVFIGSRTNNMFAGGEGRDSYDGEAGFDTVRFDRYFTDGAGPTAGVLINLTLATGQIINDGWGNTENASEIEAIEGTARADTVRGNTGDNEFAMRQGADVMAGAGGADTFAWYGDYDLNAVDRVTDFQATGVGRDSLAFYTPDFLGMSTSPALVNGTAATQAGVGTFIFNAVNDVLYWDRDGLGGAAAKAVVVLTNVAALTVDNFEFWT